MNQSNDIRETFYAECDDLIEALTDGLDEIDACLGTGVVDGEIINAVFRAVHSIKGGAGAFGLETLVRFAHCFETTLDAVRSGKLQISAELMVIFHRSSDHLSELIIASRDSGTPNMDKSAELIEQLKSVLDDDPLASSSDTAETFEFTPLVLNFDSEEDTSASHPDEYSILFSASKSLYANGNEPLFLLNALARLGTSTVSVATERLPPLDEMDVQEAYLDWTINLFTAEPESAIREVFEFVEGSCKIDIRRSTLQSALHDFTDEVSDYSSDVSSCQVAMEPASVREELAQSQEADDASTRKTPVSQRPTVRVELDRVDRLINVVGELVINQAMLSQCIQEAGISPRSDVGAGLDEFRNLAREIQETVMSIRAQSVKLLFQRMSRIAREASDLAKKSAHLVTDGEATEVDKTMIERLADPLMHMIRNAVDHGLESPEIRRQRGKPEIGTIRLSAAHRSGRVMIEVADDGAGIDRPRVKQIAVDKNLIPADAEMSDAEIDKLLFLAGFSTAKTVSDLSGRGVGMDVVRSAIQALGGRIFITSVPGKGTTFTISLPLTLAVLEGMVVDVAGQTMVVPITVVIETLRPPPADIHRIGAGAQVVAIRGSFVPIIDLGAVFGHREPVTDFDERVLLLIETDQNTRCAFAVDAIHDQRQVVIKALEDNYGYVSGVAAATILGDGRIALIVDPDEIISDASPHLPFMAN